MADESLTIRVAETTESANGQIIQTNSPTPDYVLGGSTGGAPTNTPKEALGDTTGTVVAKANAAKKHACDTTLYIDRAVAYAKFYGGQIVAAIRKGIKAIMKALSFNAGNSGLTEFLKKVKEYADDITETLKDIQNFMAAFIDGVKKINALITYILSLPGKMIDYFQNCIKEAYAELKSAYLDVVKEATDGATPDSQEMIDAAKSAYDSVSTLVSTTVTTATTAAALPAVAVATLVNPSGSTVAEQEAAAKEAGVYYDPYSSTATYAKP